MAGIVNPPETAPLALVQLISEQTMQNLLPILALRPAKLVHLTTVRTASRSGYIAQSACEAGFHVAPENVRLSEMPSISETSRAVVRAIQRSQEENLLPVVNFTGGTKLMSIGAYEAALQHRISSLYVDSDHNAFSDASTGPPVARWLGPDPSFTPLHRMLTVSAIAIANGCERVTAGRPWQQFQRLADHLLGHPVEEQKTWEAFHGPTGLCPDGREPREARSWLELLDRSISLPPAVGDAAVELGLLRRVGENLHLPDQTATELQELARHQEQGHSDNYFRAVEPLQFAVGFLTGGWWEVVVAAAANRSERFRDLRWSVQVTRRDGTMIEEDIVAVDGVQVAYFSCKRGRARSRLLPLLDEMDNRARAIGRSFTYRFLAIRHFPSGQTERNLRRRAQELRGIRLIAPKDFQDDLAFQPNPGHTHRSKHT